MKEEPPAKPRRLRLGKLHWWVLALILAGGCYQWWRINDYENAVWEAKLAGFYWECTDPIALIREDWRNALKKETWSAHLRRLDMGRNPDLARYRDLIQRLRPTRLDAGYCKDENLDALNGLTGLECLVIYECAALRNVDAIKGLTSLRILHLSGCPTLQNVDAIKELTGLQTLSLSDSPALQNVDGLKGLTNLQELDLSNCPSLKNVDALKGLTRLKSLQFWIPFTSGDPPSSAESTLIPEPTQRELRAALPNTQIYFHPGPKNLPQ